MVILYKFAISIWLLASITSVVVSVPMSHVLKVSNKNSIPYGTGVSEIDFELSKLNIKPDIVSFTVTSNVKYRYATTVVSSEVINLASIPKEISFEVTLPNAAFISGFSIQFKETVFNAYVKEKKEAETYYNEAVDQGELAGHVAMNSHNSNVFTISMNVEPQTKITFNLTYEQLLTRTLGIYENIISVNPGQLVKSMFIEINIDETSNITILQVPDLRISNKNDSPETKNKSAIIEHSGKTCKVTWKLTMEEQQEISSSGIEGQCIVRYDVDRISSPNQILLNEGYFVHFYAPSDLKPLNKHVVLTLDVSTSMMGRKIMQLREALLEILGDIKKGDYFSLIFFSNNARPWALNDTINNSTPTGYWYTSNFYDSEIEIGEQFIIPATPENIAKAKIFTNAVTAFARTNIIAALRKSIQIAQWGQKKYVKNAKPLIIFLTDGQPNVEMFSTDQIVKNITNLNVDKYPIFSLAFGEDADYNFLRKLSLSNSGFARKIYVASDTSLQLKNFYKEVASPLLSNVNFEYVSGQIVDETLTKSVFDNLFNGSELVVAGKLVKGVKTLNGHLAAQSLNGSFRTHMPPPIVIDVPHSPNKTTGHLEKLWAYLYIKQLLDNNLLSNNTNSTHKQNALKLSLKYTFVTPLTSLIVRVPIEMSNIDVHNTQNLETGFRSSGPPSLKNPDSRKQRITPSGSKGKHRFARMFKIRKGDDDFRLYNTGNYRRSYAFQTIGNSETTKTLHPAVNFSTRNNSKGLLNIKDITWLKNKTGIKFNSTDNTYSIDQSNSINVKYQICKLPSGNNALAHCRNLVHCVIPEIISNFDDFVPYGKQCVINGRFLGICCPDQYFS